MEVMACLAAFCLRQGRKLFDLKVKLTYKSNTPVKPMLIEK